MNDGSEEAERIGLKIHKAEKEKNMTDEPKQELIALLKVQQIIESLESLPASLANHLALFELKREELRVAEEDLKLAQVNAEVAAWAQVAGSPDKMLADQKKVIIEGLVAKDAEVAECNKKIQVIRAALGNCSSNFEMVKAQFQAMRSLSELASSVLNSTKGQ